jgi:hypothetical protein
LSESILTRESSRRGPNIASQAEALESAAVEATDAGARGRLLAEAAATRTLEFEERLQELKEALEGLARACPRSLMVRLAEWSARFAAITRGQLDRGDREALRALLETTKERS